MSDWDWLFGNAAASGNGNTFGGPFDGLLPSLIPYLQPQLPGSNLPATPFAPAGIIPAPGADSSAAMVPLSASTPAPASQGNAKALDWASYFPDGAASFASNMARFGSGDRAALDALKSTTPYLTGPLAIGSGIAGAVADIQQGASPLDAIVGNIVRGGLVYGAGLAGGDMTAWGGGFGAIPASVAAGSYLPPAPQIGHAVIHGILGPLPSDESVYNPAEP